MAPLEPTLCTHTHPETRTFNTISNESAKTVAGAGLDNPDVTFGGSSQKSRIV